MGEAAAAAAAAAATTTKKGWSTNTATGPSSSNELTPSKKKVLSLAEIMAEEEAEQTRREAENDAYQRAMEASMVDVDHELEAAIALSLQEEAATNNDERAEIERALWEADAAEQEAESYRLAMRLQAEEERLSVPTQRQPQGNVRIMTKQQIFLESKAHELKTTGPGGITLLGDREDYEDGHDGGGFRMNSARGSSDAWVRLDQNVIMGPNQELRTKHDIALNNQANAHRLGLNVDGEDEISGISNHAYNDFREKAKRTHQKQRRRETNKSTGAAHAASQQNSHEDHGIPSAIPLVPKAGVVELEEEKEGVTDDLKEPVDCSESEDDAVVRDGKETDVISTTT